LRDGWFSSCLAGAKTWRLDVALGCLTRGQVDAMALWRLEDDTWKDAVEKRCGKPKGATSPDVAP
jgi:hypothetical protein